MDSSFERLFDYFWLLAILTNVLNTIIIWVKTRPYVKQKPELAPGYSTLIRGFFFWVNVPWVVMGAGFLFGKVPSIGAFFEPQLQNSFVLAWWGTMFLLYGLGTYWILWNGGAEMLVKHPGFLRQTPSNPKIIKLFWLLALAGGVTASVMVLSSR